MHKLNNFKILEEMNPSLVIHLENYNADQKVTQIKEAKNGLQTISVILNGKEHYYHSKYNPLNEADAIANKYVDLENIQHILFLGTGLGYHITRILDNNPHIKFSIFEPNTIVLKAFFEKFNLKKYKNRCVEIFTDLATISDKQKFFKYYSETSIDIILPVYRNINKEQTRIFYEEIAEAMKVKKESIKVNSMLQQRWMINPIINLPLILTTPNLLTDVDKNHFKDKPVLLVSAGPSLVEDIEYIRQIKDEGRAYVFAMGSAVKSLVSFNVIPDAYFSVDPNYSNQFVVKEIKEQNLSIPICFGSSTGFETIHDYPGPKVHFMLDQDKITKYLMEYEQDIVIYDAVSVAVMTMQVLYKLQVSSIILAGQNLAYLNDRSYAEGIQYKHRSSVVTEKEKEEAKYTTSVFGEQIETNDEFLKMKSSMEFWIKRFPNVPVYNTTKNGAHIEGTSYVDIKEIIQTVLSDRNISDNSWLNSKPSYDNDAILSKLNDLEKSFDELMILLNKCLEYLEEVKASKKSNYKMLQVYLSAYDKLFDLVQDNDFYKTIIFPMTRVQQRNFVERSVEVAQEKVAKKKVELFDDIFGNYLKTIYATILHIQPAFGDMKYNLKEMNLLK